MSHFREFLLSLERSGNLRSIPQDDGVAESKVDFSMNDYLGLAECAELQREFFADSVSLSVPMTSSASRLLCSRQSEYTRLEAVLAAMYRRPALLFNSGYHANTGIVSAIGSMPSTVIIADRLVHASIIDGAILSRAPMSRFPHNDYARLSQLVERYEKEYDHLLVIVESVYSMDGDRCALDPLIALKESHPSVMLYVDEAHAVGVLGPHGLGLVAGHPRGSEVDIVVGTFGKALASAGAFAAVASDDIRDFLVNRARSFIFSTAMAPMTCAWTRYILGRMVDMDDRREHLSMLGRHLAAGLDEVFPDSAPHQPGHIMPVMIGDASRCVDISRRLLDYGVKVLPIRTPTVPPGTERLRISLSASMTFGQIDMLVHALKEVYAS